MTSATDTAIVSPKRSNRTLWILVAVCAFPYLGGWLYYQNRDMLPLPPPPITAR